MPKNCRYSLCSVCNGAELKSEILKIGNRPGPLTTKEGITYNCKNCVAQSYFQEA